MVLYASVSPKMYFAFFACMLFGLFMQAHFPFPRLFLYVKYCDFFSAQTVLQAHGLSVLALYTTLPVFPTFSFPILPHVLLTFSFFVFSMAASLLKALPIQTKSLQS